MITMRKIRAAHREDTRGQGRNRENFNSPAVWGFFRGNVQVGWLDTGVSGGFYGFSDMKHKSLNHKVYRSRTEAKEAAIKHFESI